jgi:ABC-type nitrate/sulfonate/bicarbonate transport system substrate-binding protein
MNADTQTTLQVGGVPEHFNLPWHLAIEAGTTAQCGMTVAWHEYSTGTGAMLADLAAGQLDLAVLLTEGAALGLARGLPVEPISLYTTSPLIWGVHVKPDSTYRSLNELRQARFAISRPGSGSHLMSLALALEQGWPAAELQFEIVDNLPGAIAAFREGRAEVFLWEHFTTQPQVDAGLFRRIGDFVSPWPAWVVCASAASWQENAPAIRTLLAIVAATAGRLAGSADRAELISRRYGLRKAEVLQWLEKTSWVEELTPPDAALGLAQNMLQAAGAL